MHIFLRHDHHCHRFTGVGPGLPQPRSTSFEVKKNRPGTLDECLARSPGGRLQPQNLEFESALFLGKFTIIALNWGK